MSKKMLIDATHAEETRVVVVDGNKVEEFDFESENKRQLAGNIYLAKVTRVEPSLQAAFVDYGGNRHGFLAFSEIHPDYYQIPVADREALLAEEMAYAEAEAAEEDKPKKRRGRGRGKSKAAEATKDETVTAEVPAEETPAETEAAESGEDVKPQTEAEVAAADDAVVEPVAEEAGSSESEEAGANAEKPEETPAEAKSSEESTAEEPVAEDASTEAPADGADAKLAAIPGMDVVDLDDSDDEDPAFEEKESASDKDSSIESVADDDTTEEIRPRRKQRPRRYKIQEVVKVRQILLVQVVKEERGNKGAALTTYLSLAGRYCVLMPNTARGGGISRKITNASDRKKLKEIATEIDVPRGAGLIIRTAGAKRTKTEIKRDYEYLQRMWEQIRELTLKSIAPAQIYEEGNLIKRSIRDLYSREIEEVLVEGELGYRTAKDFMKMIMPSHAKNVKFYAEPMPLFARYQVESYLAGMFNPTVQLRSGGYIVIGVTEALVAIDVNSGKATKENSIEETALKTNLEAAEEVARQLRLRDLAGLIVIDYIDMEERRNNSAVEKRFKDRLKTDSARIQVGRISGFGLMEMSRQRLRPGMLEATTQPCPSCHGTGLIRSDDSLGLTILRHLEEEGVRRRSREVLVKAPVSIINFLMNHKREHIAQIEARYGMAVRLEADPFLVSPDFTVEKFKTATRVIDTSAPVVSVDASLMAEIEEELAEEAVAEAAATPEADEGEERPKKKRRRRRRRRGGNRDGEAQAQTAEGQGETADVAATEQAAEADAEPAEAAEVPDAPEAEEAKPKKRTRTRRKKPAKDAEVAAEATPEAAAEEAPSEEVKADTAEVQEEEKPKKRTRSRAKKKPAAEEAMADATPVESAPVEANGAAVVAEAPAVEAAPEPTPEPAVVAEVAEAPAEPAKPRRRGWWSVGKG
ncbi:MAG: Rne/Rng family ribonuclease [Boseongicola sp.]|nr:MAG: Rne/Rng family ribonuclease [Boseongicola sp.]